MNDNIVIADNDSEYSEAIAALLREKSFKVQTVANGIKAAEDLNKSISEGQRLPRLLIVDLSLPELDGIELLSNLAKEGNLCTVVAISSELKEEDLRSFIRTPFVKAIHKKDPKEVVEHLIAAANCTVRQSSTNKSNINNSNSNSNIIDKAVAENNIN